MSYRRLSTNVSEGGKEQRLLSPVAYDDDAASIHSRSDQDSDSDDDELQSRARNSRELAAADRMVLVEDDDIDRLVLNSRQNQHQDQQRRGSLAVPNPLKIFGRRRSSASSQNSFGGREEMKQQRRDLRRQKREKKQLMKGAKREEARALMYEMEAGGMKDPASSEDDGEQDSSDEVDRQKLYTVTQHRTNKWRAWRRLIFIYLVISIGFTMLVLIAWKMSKGRKSSGPGANLDDYTSNGTALFGPTTIILSLDGFRADFLQRGLTPRLNAFIKEGVSPRFMLPSFPSVTFPNHYTMATGLYPESHGIVGNTFWDPNLLQEFYYTDPARSFDPKWWGGEPFWVTAELQGIRSAVHMWPGSEGHIHHVEPSFLDKFNAHEPLDRKVSRILEFLDKPGKEDDDVDWEETRPQLIAAYVPNVDQDGHLYGPNSTEIRSTIQEVDGFLENLFQGLEDRNLTNIVNVMVVSDHGMATTDISRMIQLEDLVDTDKIEHIDGWPLYGLRPKNPDHLEDLFKSLMVKSASIPAIDVYLKQSMPKRYHFSNNDRIAPLWIVPKTGWAIVTKDEFNVKEALEKGTVYHPRGLHGYDNEHPLMRAIFVARGPAFPHPPNSQVAEFQNTEIYNVLCDSIGLKPKPNNGTLRLPFKPMGIHNPEDHEEVPEDPVEYPGKPEGTEQAPKTTESSSPEKPQPSTKPDSGDKEDSSEGDEEEEEEEEEEEPKDQDQKDPEEQEGDSEEQSPDEEELPSEEGGTWWSWFKQKVGWVKDKALGVWHKATGDDTVKMAKKKQEKRK